MTVRRAVPADLARIAELYRGARHFMRRSGNPTQWLGGYPGFAVVKADIRAGRCYVLSEGNQIRGVFVFFLGEDPTYAVIDGAWRQEGPYGVIHRVAGDGRTPGIFRRCFEFCREQAPSLRVDTHRDNLPMRRAVEKAGFQYRGIIHLADGSPRMAYEYTE